ncbi:hypothetical protein [Microbacterium foliorum]|nr:hypothetical protein [Microbacterium foliorum]
MPAPQPRTRILDALHRSRMEPYLVAAHHNEKRALSLYRWHTELTAAVQAVLGIAEVVLRNTIDRELQGWNNNQTNGTRSWLLAEPASPLRSLSAGKRKEALERAQKAADRRPAGHRRHGLPVTHDDVLAHITFGLWKELLPNHLPGAADPSNSTVNANREFLWTDCLEAAFPNEADADGRITFWRVAHLHLLRNRVSHMEPLLDVDVADRIQEALALVRSIDRDVANWVSGANRVPVILRDRPDV